MVNIKLSNGFVHLFQAQKGSHRLPTLKEFNFKSGLIEIIENDYLKSYKTKIWKKSYWMQNKRDAGDISVYFSKSLLHADKKNKYQITKYILFIRSYKTVSLG